MVLASHPKYNKHFLCPAVPVGFQSPFGNSLIMRRVCAGSGRFKRLRKAVEEGNSSPPVDLRYLRRPLARLDAESCRARITSFLEEIYQSVAENLPDVKDSTADDVELTLHTADGIEEDQYTVALSEDALVSVPAPPGSGKKRIRTSIKSVKISDDRHPSKPMLEIRWLPPGRIIDYWNQLRAAHPSEKVAFSYFWKVPCLDSWVHRNASFFMYFELSWPFHNIHGSGLVRGVPSFEVPLRVLPQRMQHPCPPQGAYQRVGLAPQRAHSSDPQIY